VRQQLASRRRRQRSRLVEQKRDDVVVTQHVGRRRSPVRVLQRADAEDDVVLRHRRNRRALDRCGHSREQRLEVLLKERRQIGAHIHGIAEPREVLPRNGRWRIQTQAQRDHAEVEHARRHLGVVRLAVDDDALGAEDDADGRVRDLHRLRFAPQRTNALRRIEREQLERPVEMDLVADIEQTIDDRAATDP
jgi:hypothetical protein